MIIDSVSLSVFEMPSNTNLFDLEELGTGQTRRWVRRNSQTVESEVHVLHVHTDAGIEGVCTVGDARYTTMRRGDLEHLRHLVIGADPFARERLNSKLRAATRGIFTKNGWFGAFDNCLWDIAGKASNLPVYRLLGSARDRCPAYYNYGGVSIDAAVDDALSALEQGFPALKDHFSCDAAENSRWFRAVRDAVGAGVDLLHDAAGCAYAYEDAVRVGRLLHELHFGWFEEPFADRSQNDLQRLCADLEIPVLAPETLMHDRDLSAQWLISGALDALRANARHGVTPTMKLAHLAELHNKRIELNGPGGLFGLVHVHLVCAIANTSYYEYFPRGSRDEVGKEIGLLNPPLPVEGYVAPPDGPGWGAEWDWDTFKRKRVAVV